LSLSALRTFRRLEPDVFGEQQQLADLIAAQIGHPVLKPNMTLIPCSLE
jgi:hypothetical protein